MFSRGFFFKVVESRDCVVKSESFTSQLGLERVTSIFFFSLNIFFFIKDRIHCFSNINLLPTNAFDLYKSNIFGKVQKNKTYQLCHIQFVFCRCCPSLWELQKVLTLVSLHNLRRLTTVKTFRYRQIFCVLTDNFTLLGLRLLCSLFIIFYLGVSTCDGSQMLSV